MGGLNTKNNPRTNMDKNSGNEMETVVMQGASRDKRATNKFTVVIIVIQSIFQHGRKKRMLMTKAVLGIAAVITGERKRKELW